MLWSSLKLVVSSCVLYVMNTDVKLLSVLFLIPNEDYLQFQYCSNKLTWIENTQK